MPTLPKESDWLRANVTGKIVEVDRNAQVIRGYIVAQQGPFWTPDRGEFDKDGLKEIVKLMKAAPNGLKSRFAHPGVSSDGIGSYLGRAKDPWLDKITARDSKGELKTDEIVVVRADLHLDPTSRKTPNGDLGGYIMDLAESDPDALSSSLVTTPDQKYRTDAKGRPLKDDDGKKLPPLWHPLKLHATDMVDTGDAVDGLLSAKHGLSIDGLPDAVVRQGAALLDRQFAGQTRDVIEARCTGWLQRYLDLRYGEPVEVDDSLERIRTNIVRRRRRWGEGVLG